ncbi:MAG TPA: winged helix-turn-helix transcriptional regulator [Acidimicrobiales bacterium]|nr:winged helix-turn-helix transcriptional regulator [Acidimicrobiales bacterium]
MSKSYGQYCPIAEALDVVGERWTLLIARELLTGPQRFTDLRAGLPGIPPNLLSSRLRELEDAGLIARRELPPPAARTVYELTEEGLGLEPTLRALARWGMHRLPPDDGSVSPAAAVRAALVAYARPRAASAPQRTWAAHVGGEAFTLQLEDGRVSYRSGDPVRADLVVSADPADLMRLRRGDARPLRRPAVRYQPNDRELIGEFRAVFNLA